MSSKSRRTIARDSVFRGTGAADADAPVVQGLPPQDPPTRQTAVWLADPEVEWLDAQIMEIRRGGWRNVTRSALIRALIRSGMERSPELRGASGEEELTQRLVSPT